jgi:outer membrane protein assembly factor BamB
VIYHRTTDTISKREIMHTPENEPDIVPELPDDEYVQITDLDSPDAPAHPVTRFWRRLPFASLTPRARLLATIVTGVVTFALLLVFLSVSLVPAFNNLETAQNQGQVRNHISYLTYPLDMSVVGNVAYVTTSSYLIAALRISDGSLLWQYQLDVKPLQTPVVVNGMVYFETVNEDVDATLGNVYALHSENGKLAWQRTVPFLTPGTFDVQQGIVIVSAQNTLLAIHASNGSIAWHYNSGFLPPEYVLPDTNTENIYVNSQFGDLYALNIQNGSVMWHYAVDKQHFSLTQVVGGIVYATSQDGTLYAVQSETGRPLWHFSGSSGKNLAGALLTVQGSIVYLSTSDGMMNALRFSDGKLLWQYKKSGTIWDAPISVGNAVYLSSQLGLIDALQVDTGTLLWHHTSSDTSTAFVSADNQHIYVVSRDGVLDVLNANSGTLLWRYQESNTAQGSPVIASGAVLMTFSDGMMYALSLNDGRTLWHVHVSIFSGGFTLVLHDIIYIGAPQGGVSALRLSNGAQVWHNTTVSS